MGDTGKHIVNVTIKNFKRFESFEMKDLGQFNLILGDNNVGKTSLLEALLFSGNHYQTISNLVGALKFRKLISECSYKDLELYRNISVKGINNVFDIDVRYFFRDNQYEYFNILIDKGHQEIVVNISSSSNKSSTITQPFSLGIGFDVNFNFPFIPFYRGHDEDLTKFYGRLQTDRSLKNQIIENLRILLPDIENIEPSYTYEKPHLIVYQKHMNQTLPLAVFGDGTLKLFRLLAEIVLNAGGRLMIDEIDTGIHYSRFREFWKVILKSAHQNHVQLFMTTHNEECIKYFKEVLEDEVPDLQKEARSIVLVENPTTKQVTSITYSFEEFEHALNVGNEIRG
jgi:AAA15 family ATPase/GTPase